MSEGSEYPSLALSDSGFLFDTRTGRTFSLNPTGTFIVRALMNGVAADAVAAAVVEEFEVEEDTARRDVDQFLFRLKDLRIT